MALLTLFHFTPVLTPCLFQSGTQGSRSCLPRLYLSLSKATTYPLSTLVGSGSKPYRDERDSKLLMIAPWSGDHVCPWHLSHLEDGFCVVCSLYCVCCMCVCVVCLCMCGVCVHIQGAWVWIFIFVYMRECVWYVCDWVWAAQKAFIQYCMHAAGNEVIFHPLVFLELNGDWFSS